VLVVAVLCVASGGAAGPIPGAKTKMVYAVSAHPDDEIPAWGAIERRPRIYTVFVIMTKGEQTFSCKTIEESLPNDDQGLGFEDATMVEGLFGHSGRAVWDGAYRYQGPGSPVDQPDLGERHPLGNPWVGRGTRACADARVASWHWFLDGMAALDASLANMEIAGDPYLDDDYVGESCDVAVGCVEVWANEQGARVAFDLGDSGFLDPAGDPLTAQDVTSALQVLRANRVSFGLPALPEAGMVAALYYYDGDDPNCDYYDHADHGAVTEALYETDQGAGPQVGPTCHTDPRFLNAPSLTTPMSPLTLVPANFVDPVTEQRMGTYVVNYGWLFDTYKFNGDPNLVYWKRFS
jgi:hypothetical protein